jgi:hypothetical protein
MHMYSIHAFDMYIIDVCACTSNGQMRAHEQMHAIELHGIWLNK